MASAKQGARKRAGRPRGHRNADFAQTRASLVARCRAHLMQPNGARASFRELAAAAEVSVPTLRHYFGTRAQLVSDVLAATLTDGLEHLQAVAAGPLPPTLRASISWFVSYLAEGLAHGVDRVHTFSLAQGLGDAVIGPAYVEKILEPTLRALEARLERHIARGDMRACDARGAALFVVAPILLGRLHQGPLGGARCRSLDERALREEVVDAFVRAYGSRTAQSE